MSEPPSTNTPPSLPLPPPPTAATYPPTAIITSSSYINKNQQHSIINATPTITIREYRKGNWTLEETLILITAKKLDDERRINNNNASASTGGTGELRWKWVENYCWSNGCLRSQNQCNDKWDNLLRDYKKVREYQNQNQNQTVSYWSMERTQRKQRNLPSNMLLNIYQALDDVVQRKHHNRHSFHQNNQQQQQLPSVAVVPPPAQLLAEVPPPPPSEASAESSETQGDESDKVNAETKRRKMRDVDIGSSMLHSTTLLSQTLRHYDDKKEKRHRELMELEHKRLQLEETRNQVNHQGFASLITSINKLSDAIHALISEKRT